MWTKIPSPITFSRGNNFQFSESNILLLYNIIKTWKFINSKYDCNIKAIHSSYKTYSTVIVIITAIIDPYIMCKVEKSTIVSKSRS